MPVEETSPIPVLWIDGYSSRLVQTWQRAEVIYVETSYDFTDLCGTCIVMRNCPVSYDGCRLTQRTRWLRKGAALAIHYDLRRLYEVWSRPLAAEQMCGLGRALAGIKFVWCVSKLNVVGVLAGERTQRVAYGG